MIVSQGCQYEKIGDEKLKEGNGKVIILNNIEDNHENNESNRYSLKDLLDDLKMEQQETA